MQSYRSRYGGDEDEEDEEKQVSRTTEQEATQTSELSEYMKAYRSKYGTPELDEERKVGERWLQTPEEEEVEVKPVAKQKKTIWEKIDDTFQKLTKLTQGTGEDISIVDKEAQKRMKEATMKEVPKSEVLKKYEEDPIGYLVDRPFYSSEEKYLVQDKDLSAKEVVEEKMKAYGDYYNSLNEVGKAMLTNPIEGLSDDSYAYIKLNADNILKETDLEIQTLYSKLKTADKKDAKEIKKYIAELEEQKKDLEYIQKGIVENKGFIEGLKEGTTMENVPIIGTFIRANDAIDTLRAWRKFENGEELDTREKMLVNKLRKAEIESISEQKGIGYNIGSGLISSASLIVEIGLALAIPTKVDDALLAASRSQKGVGKLLGGATNLLWKAGKITANPVVGVPKIIAGTAEYQAPEMAFDWQENDFDKIEEGDELGKALIKSIANEYGNNLIEIGLGDVLDASTSAVKKGLGNLIGKQINATSKNAVITFLKTKGGWNGFLGEFAEEIAQKYWEEGVIENKKVTFTPEELISIAGSVLLLQMAGEVAGGFGVDQESMREQIETEAEANIRATIQEADRRITEEGGIPPTPAVDEEEEMLKADMERIRKGLVEKGEITEEGGISPTEEEKGKELETVEKAQEITIGNETFIVPETNRNTLAEDFMLDFQERLDTLETNPIKLVREQTKTGDFAELYAEGKTDKELLSMPRIKKWIAREKEDLKKGLESGKKRLQENGYILKETKPKTQKEVVKEKEQKQKKETRKVEPKKGKEEGTEEADYSENAQVQEVLRDIGMVLDVGARKKVVTKVSNMAETGYESEKYEYGVEGVEIPDFIPEELRNRKYIQKAYDAFLNNTVPQEGTKAWQVYQAILEESESREGIGAEEPEIGEIEEKVREGVKEVGVEKEGQFALKVNKVKENAPTYIKDLGVSDEAVNIAFDIRDGARIDMKEIPEELRKEVKSVIKAIDSEINRMIAEDEALQSAMEGGFTREELAGSLARDVLEGWGDYTEEEIAQYKKENPKQYALDQYIKKVNEKVKSAGGYDKYVEYLEGEIEAQQKVVDDYKFIFKTALGSDMGELSKEEEQEKEKLAMMKKEMEVLKESPLAFYNEEDVITDEDLPFRQRELKVLNDKLKDQMSIDQMKEISMIWFGDENVELVKNILRNKKALGAYLNRLIKIKNGQAHVGSTFYHEAVHKAFDIFLTPDEKKAIMKEVVKRVGRENLLKDWNTRNTKEKTRLMSYQNEAFRIFAHYQDVIEKRVPVGTENIIKNKGVWNISKEKLDTFAESYGIKPENLWSSVVEITDTKTNEQEIYLVDGKTDAVHAEVLIDGAELGIQTRNGKLYHIRALQDKHLSPYANIKGKFDVSTLPYSDDVTQKNEQRKYRNQFGITKTGGKRVLSSEDLAVEASAQEWLAENIIDYVNNKNSTTFWGKLKRMVDVFIDRMFRGIDHIKDIDDFYESIMSGRLLERQQKLEAKQRENWNKFIESIRNDSIKTDKAFINGRINPEYRQEKRRKFRQQVGGVLQPLITLHNISADNLFLAQFDGKLPAPSLAVTKPEHPIRGFGEITLIGGREIIDPEVNKENRLYSHDVYSPRVPAPQYDINKKEWQKFYYNKEIQDVFDSVDSEQYSFYQALQESDPKQGLLYVGKERSHGMKALYLKERGVEIPIVYKPANFPYQEFINTKTFKKNEIFLMGDITAEKKASLEKKKEIFKEIVKEEAENNNRLDTQYKKDVYIKDIIENYTQSDLKFGDMLYGMYKSLRDMKELKSGDIVDRYETKDAIEKKVKEIDGGSLDKYNEWVEEYFENVFSEPYITIGGKKEPYTTENKVRAMFGKGVKGQEGTIFGGGVNFIKAIGAKQYKSIAQAKRDSYGRLVSEAEYDEITKKQYDELEKRAKKLEKYNKYSTNDYNGELEFDYRGSEHLEYVMTDYAKKGKTTENFLSALENNGYEFDPVADEQLIEETKKWADKLLSDPVPYLEAKPRRAVALNEFSGAILPDYYKGEGNKEINKKIVEILNKNGINRIFYVPYDTLSEKARIINEEFEDIKYRTSDNPAPEAVAMEMDSAVSVKLPELITMATELGANIKLQSSFRKAGKLGDFTAGEDTDSRIRILRSLFEPAGEEVVNAEGKTERLPETPEQQMDRIHAIERVLAHEIGHLFDWFGGVKNMTLKRGNILGRIANLRNYTEGQFMDLENKQIRKELKTLTQVWNPFDEATAPKKYKTYRYSAKELYAEALSVFLNKPSLVKEVAPNFYEAFVEYMTRKKEVSTEYFAIRDMIKEGNEVQKRVENMKKAQVEARGKRMTIEEEMEAYRKQSKWQEGITAIKMGFANQYAPYLDKMRKAWKDKKISLSKLEEAEQLMGDLALKGNDTVKYAQEIQEKFITPVSEAGIDLDTIGQILELERILGDRKDLANPHGLSYDYAKETYDYVKSQLNPAQWILLQEKLSWWRDYNFALVKKGYEAGVYSEKFFKEVATVNKNTYTPFAVVEYIVDNYVKAGVMEAVGTTKGIENTLTTQMLKSISLMKLTAVNGAKQDVVKTFLETFPEEVIKAKPIKNNKGETVGFERNAELERKGYEQLELLEDGKRTAYYMDKYIVSMFESSLNGVGWDIARFVTAPLRMVNRIFKPAVTVAKASFQFYSNPVKDYLRSFTNLTALSGLFDKSNVASRTGKVFKAFTKEWIKNLKRSWDYSGGEIDAVTQKMLDMYVLSSRVKYEDIDIGNEKFSFDPVKNRIVYKGGVNWLESLRDFGSTIPIIKSTLVPIYDFYMRAGSTLEVNSKIAGFQYLESQVGEEKAAFYTRKYVGTPDYMQKGKFTPLTNELIVFSNVGIQAITADAELATRPSTASGYWMSTVIKVVFPKLLMLLGASILKVPIPDPDDPEKKKWVNPYDYLSEYYKSMYMAFPTGYDEESGSFLFVKVPQDEVAGVIGNLVWKMGTYLQGEGMKVEQLGSAIAGLIPFTTGDNPLLSIGRDWLQYAQGRNPYDDFRGRLAINTTKWNEGGMTRFTEMLKWTTNELGLTNFSTYDKSSDTTLEKVMNLPLLERMFELTNYGLQEREEWEKAVGKQERNKVLDGYIESYYAEPSNKKLLELQEKYVISVKGERPKKGWSGTEKAEETRLKQEFKREILANSGNAVYKSIARAGIDNDEKLEIINAQKRKMSDSEFTDFMTQLVRYEIVKGEMFATYVEEKNLGQDLVYNVVKESIPVLSADSNDTLVSELRKRDVMSNSTLRRLTRDKLIKSAGYNKYIKLNKKTYEERYGDKDKEGRKVELF